jgi:hypothetical protein
MKVITGGQTGVDTGALLGAEKAGTTWRAILPKGFRRETPIPEWMQIGGTCGLPARETDSGSYAQRTRVVVNIADGVLILHPEGEVWSPGTKLTRELAIEAGHPWHWHRGNYKATLAWLNEYRPSRLMVAGPRLSKWDSGEFIAEALVYWLLEGHKKEIPADTIHMDDVDGLPRI